MRLQMSQNLKTLSGIETQERNNPAEYKSPYPATKTLKPYQGLKLRVNFASRQVCRLKTLKPYQGLKQPATPTKSFACFRLGSQNP